MDALISSVGTTLIAWGPPGVVALIAIGLWWVERKDRKETQTKLEKALTDWKTDTEAQGNKLQAILERFAK